MSQTREAAPLEGRVWHPGRMGRFGGGLGPLQLVDRSLPVWLGAALLLFLLRPFAAPPYERLTQRGGFLLQREEGGALADGEAASEERLEPSEPLVRYEHAHPGELLQKTLASGQ